MTSRARVRSVAGVTTVCCAVVFSLSQIALAELQTNGSPMDWPTFRGDNARSGATTENFPGASFAWRIVPPSPPRRAWSEAEGRTI